MLPQASAERNARSDKTDALFLRATLELRASLRQRGLNTAHGETPLTRRPRDLYHLHAGGIRRAQSRIRSDMRRPDPSPVARDPKPSPCNPRISRGFKMIQ
jgi:hypothetical protein